MYIVNWFKQYHIIFTTDQIGTDLWKPLMESGWNTIDLIPTNYHILDTSSNISRSCYHCHLLLHYDSTWFHSSRHILILFPHRQHSSCQRQALWKDLKDACQQGSGSDSGKGPGQSQAPCHVSSWGFWRMLAPTSTNTMYYHTLDDASSSNCNLYLLLVDSMTLWLL